MQKLIWALIASCILFSSCENDLDILEEYKEIPIIYSLINPASTTHYVRVQKAFLGAGNALLMAQESDSLYYDTAKVSVYLEKLLFNSVINTYKFKPDYTQFKAEGLFTDLNHYVFRLENVRLDPTAQYQLRFENIESGLVVTGKTRIIEPIYQKTLSPTTRINIAADDPYNIRFNSSKHGKMYGLIMRIRYTETKKLTQAITTKYVDYRLSNLTSLNLNGGQELSFLLNGKSIYQFLGSRIKEDTTVTRRLIDFKSDFIFTSATDDFYNYLQINSPNNTVNFIPEFTNLSAGKGIFTCRLDTIIPDISFNDLSYDSLLNGSYTNHIFK
ncbi:MAG: DUF4249 family protein [Bacteroidetes bacterium]|nr:DUF4249 family protein [Bacteroidota bacterium]